MVMLKECCTLLTDGNWIESKDQSDSGIRLVQTGNIGNGVYLEKESRAKYISQETFERLNCTEVFPGDILVSRLPDPVGRACIIPEKTERMITAVDCSILRVDKSVVDVEYLQFFLRSKRYFNQLSAKLAGTTRTRISRKNLEKVTLNIPSKDTQKAIVNTLNHLMFCVRARERELQLLDELIKARFVEMFGTINNPHEGCRIQSIQEVCEPIKDGTHQTPEYTDDKNNGYLFLSSKDVTSGYIDWDHPKYIPEYLHNELYSRVAPHKGDILLAKNGTTGIAAVVDRNEVFDIYVSLAWLRPIDVNSVFLWGAINNEDTKRQFNSSLKGIGVPNLHLGEIKKTKIIIADKKRQQEYANFVAQVDKSKDRFKRLTAA